MPAAPVRGPPTALWRGSRSIRTQAPGEGPPVLGCVSVRLHPPRPAAGSGVAQRGPPLLPSGPLRCLCESGFRPPAPPSPVYLDPRLTWRTVPMRVGAGVGGRTVAPQGGVPFTAVRGGKRQGPPELRVGGGGCAQGTGSGDEPPPCCGGRELSDCLFLTVSCRGREA